MAKRFVLAAVASALVFGAATPASADVDATGRWIVKYSYGFGVPPEFWPVIVENMVQTGTALSSDNGWNGTINPATGGYNQTRVEHPPCADGQRSGFFASDGKTFSGGGYTNPGTIETLCEPYNLPTSFNGARCGDGAINYPEECDDGDLSSGDGCSDVCSVEECFACAGEPSTCGPSGAGNPCEDHDVCTAESQCDANGNCTGPVTLDCDDGDICTDDPCLPASGCDHVPTTSCDDGSFCTADSCDSDLGCQHAPAVRSCRAAGKSLLLITDKADDRDKLVWRWVKGATTAHAELADPRSSAVYELCLFAGAAPSVVAKATVGPDASKWTPMDNGFRYHDAKGSQDGIERLLLEASDDDNAKIVLKGSGMNLPDPHPPLSPPLTIQLTNTETGVCWGASYATADPNESGKLRAKTTAP